MLRADVEKAFIAEAAKRKPELDRKVAELRQEIEAFKASHAKRAREAGEPYSGTIAAGETMEDFSLREKRLASEKRAANYRRLAGLTGDQELKRYYESKAAEAEAAGRELNDG